MTVRQSLLNAQCDKKTTTVYNLNTFCLDTYKHLNKSEDSICSACIGRRLMYFLNIISVSLPISPPPPPPFSFIFGMHTFWTHLRIVLNASRWHKTQWRTLEFILQVLPFVLFCAPRITCAIRITKGYYSINLSLPLFVTAYFFTRRASVERKMYYH